MTSFPQFDKTSLPATVPAASDALPHGVCAVPDSCCRLVTLHGSAARFARQAWRALAALLIATPCALADHPTVGVAGAGAGPINTANATTLPKGLFALTLGVEYVNVDRYSNAELESFGEQGIEADSANTELVPYIGAAYGVTDDFMLGARLPYVFIYGIREPAEGGGVADEGNVNGLGDTTLFGQYRVFNDTASQFEVALIAGMQLPTGADREHAPDGDLLETEHQPGSGAWDPLLGVVATRRFGRHTVSTQLMYTHANTGSQGTNLGDVINYNLGWSYHVGGPDPHVDAEPAAPHVHQHADGSMHVHDDGAASSGDTQGPAHAHGGEDLGYDLVLELNGVRREELTVGGVRDGDSGGNRLFLSPGVRVPMSERSSFFASVGVPLYEHVNGAEHRTDYLASMGWSFAY